MGARTPTAGLGSFMGEESMRPELGSASVVSALIVALLVIGLAGPARAVQQAPGTTAPGIPRNFDVRTTGSAGLDRAIAAHAVTGTVQQARSVRALSIQKGLTQLRVASPGAEVTASPLTGGVE